MRSELGAGVVVAWEGRGALLACFSMSVVLAGVDLGWKGGA